MPDNIYSLPLEKMSKDGITINAVLMVLNLLPLPPLDGGRIAVSLLPMRAAIAFSRIEPWGFPILLVLLFTGILGAILSPFVDVVRMSIAAIFGLV